MGFPTWKKVVVFLVCLLSVLYTLPNFVGKDLVKDLPSWVPKKSVNLGLDLQGGSYLLMEVDTDALKNQRLKALTAGVRREFRNATPKIFYNLLSADTKKELLSIQLKNSQQQGKAVQLIGGAFPDFDIKQTAGNLTLSLKESAVVDLEKAAVSKTIEIIRRRIDATGTKEPIIQSQGTKRILLQLPGVDNPEEIKNLIGQTAQLSFHLVDTRSIGADGLPPLGSRFYPDKQTGQNLLVKDEVTVSGEDLKGAKLDYSNSRPVVAFQFNRQGAMAFAQATSNNIGGRLAIILDGEIISAPSIKSSILQGRGIIEGGFTPAQAADLSLLLRSGALPAPVKFLQESSVGAGLGKDSVQAGKWAAIAGLVFVALFMFFHYRRFGLFADIALVFNIFLILAVLSILQATLTLPGIAGIVLTMGMAVDANVLIFERIREELDAGRKPMIAVETGFKRAFTTIVDSNLTTLIAAFILFAVGTGPIRGFAVTLSIGILASMFTAIMLTRYLVIAWVMKTKPKKMKIAGEWSFLKNVHFDFMGKRKLAFIVSGVLVLASLGLFATKGLNLGIDFLGGVLLEVETTGQPDASVSSIREKLKQLDLGEVVVQRFGKKNDLLIRVQAQQESKSHKQAKPQQKAADQTTDMSESMSKNTADTQQQAIAQDDDGGYNDIIKMVKEQIKDQVVQFRRAEVVGATIGDELKQAALLSVLLSVASILTYVWFRFEWQFGLTAVLALCHDVIMTIGLFAIFHLEFNLSTVAALLTIAGYSINDTVVVFDRVRELFRRHKKMELSKVLNLAINMTLSRTLMTSWTTLLALLALLIFGPAVIFDFSLALTWGIVVGTYSSIFIAVPLLLIIKPPRGDAEENHGFNAQLDKVPTKS